MRFVFVTQQQPTHIFFVHPVLPNCQLPTLLGSAPDYCFLPLSTPLCAGQRTATTRSKRLGALLPTSPL